MANYSVNSWKDWVTQSDPEWFTKSINLTVYKFSNKREFKQKVVPGQRYSWVEKINDDT